MPEFLNPFSGMVPRKMTKEELIRAIRLDLSAEEEAVHLYMAHADATDDPLAKKVLIDIANEERVHAGEFQRLLTILAPDEEKFLQDGAREVNDMNAQVAGVGGLEESDGGVPVVIEEEQQEDVGSGLINPMSGTGEVRTIGSLMDES